MSNLDRDRLDGPTVGLGCHGCPLFDACGGWTRRGGGWSCKDVCTECDPDTCSFACLKRPDALALQFASVGGFGLENVPALPQPGLNQLPPYVPTIQHGSSREVPLALPWAAVPLREVCGGNPYAPKASSPDRIRRRFGLDERTRLLLLGTGQDGVLERYWRHRSERVASELASLGFGAAIAPNFSVGLREPRPEHLYSRKRSLVSAAQWVRHGLPAIPYLHAIAEHDWKSWAHFLGAHTEISVVAKEFQTGLANPKRGVPALDQIARLQDIVRRPLHLVAIAGFQFHREIGRRFATWTVVDSQPFMSAINHRALLPGISARSREHAPSETVDDLLFHNISVREQMVGRAAALSRRVAA